MTSLNEGTIPEPTASLRRLADATGCQSLRLCIFQRNGVNGSCMDVPFNVQANDESEVKRQVTPEYVMENVSDDWGVPIANVTVVKAEAVLRR